MSTAARAEGKEQYRAFARSHRGDATRGKSLFFDEQRLACSRCHTLDGKGAKAAPDLSSAGDEFPRRDLIESVLSPSATIAVGYTTTIVKTKSGQVYDGIVKDTKDGGVSLMGADGNLVHVRGDEIQRRRTSDVSLMPEGLEAGLTPQEFTDLIEYLVSLELPETVAATRQGMPANIPEAKTPVALVPFHSEEHRFDRPDWFGQIPGMANAFLVCEHETGRIWLLEKSAAGETKTLFGDFGREIRRGAATGLLGLAFHPKFRENRRYYIQHEHLEDGKLYASVSEKRASANFRRDSGQPSRRIIHIECATDVHTGGGIEFGPDGFLYVGMGDTGPQHDPQGHGQDLKLLLGKMLRIDVDRGEDGKPYGIPPDNPFCGVPDARPEIWACGFREPWRFSFDAPTGELWVGDVGQDRFEEVALVRRGENHGWNVYEGFEPFSGRYRRPGAAYMPPVFAYARKYGNSVTGGYVYRGDKTSSFYGVYVCGDFTSKRIWGLTHENCTLKTIQQIGTSPQPIASFGTDEAGGLYLVGYEGTIYKIDFRGSAFEGPAAASAPLSVPAPGRRGPTGAKR